jgi:hypothetical protein
MTHSPEPWGCHDKGTEFPTICKERENGTCHEIAELTGCQGMTHEERVANGERIVACVNACRGIPTEDLEKIIENRKNEQRILELFRLWTPRLEHAFAIKKKYEDGAAQ